MSPAQRVRHPTGSTAFADVVSKPGKAVISLAFSGP